MAEPFGIIAGAIGIAAAFYTCMECFEYAQSGRHAQRDLETQELLLACAQYRLSEWGESVNVLTLEDSPAQPQKVQLAKITILKILELFHEALQITTHYRERPAESSSTAVAALTQQLSSMTLQRQQSAISKQRGLLKRARWALKDEKAIGKLVQSIIPLIEQLESLFPVPKQVRQQGYQIALRQLDPSQQTALGPLEDTVRVVDPTLAMSIRECVENRIEVSRNELTGRSKMAVGTLYGIRHSGSGSVDKTKNDVIQVTENIFSEDTKIHVGGQHGVKGFWDD